MRNKPTTCKVSLWNVTGSIAITSHADEAHKAICLVDFTVKLGDSETARDLLSGIGNVLELDENQRDYLSYLLFVQPDLLKSESRKWRGEQLLDEAAKRHARQNA